MPLCKSDLRGRRTRDSSDISYKFVDSKMLDIRISEAPDGSCVETVLRNRLAMCPLVFGIDLCGNFCCHSGRMPAFPQILASRS